MTPFLEGVQKNLSSQLLNLPEKYSISALLDLWVSCLFVRSVIPVHLVSSLFDECGACTVSALVDVANLK